MDDKPRVSIGLPVFNGENYLAETMDSLLAQTFTDFELVIADNASTDKTAEICRAYAAQDPRIRYFRHKENLGAAANYNYVFAASVGEYFKWAAHDDLCGPEFLERCVKVLDREASVILAYPRTKEIGQHGEVLKMYEAKPNLCAQKPHERFYECVCVSNPCVAVFGLVRADVLRQTQLIGSYASSDRPLLGELSLLGRFHEIPDFLFFKRVHPQAHWKVYPTRQLRQAWFDPAKAKKITFPHWRLLREHLMSIKRARVSWYERIWCYIYQVWWIRLNWRFLAKNLILQEP